MLYVNGNNIYLTRGDTAYLEVPIKNKTTGIMYEVADGDVLTLTVRVGVKKNSTDNNFLFQKKIGGGDAFCINAADTANLAYGEYHYDVELETESGDTYTVIADSRIILTNEVT